MEDDSMAKRAGMLTILVAMAVLTMGARGRPLPVTLQLEESRIYIEYNATDEDLGFHIFLDGEDWNELTIADPRGRVIFEVRGRGGFGRYGMTELFFEGAEPSLEEVRLRDLLAQFPEGKYRFAGRTVDGSPLKGEGRLTHAIPAGPEVSTNVNGDTVVILWEPVTEPPDGFPDRDIEIAGYQVIVGSFQVTLPASATQVTLPHEFVQSLEPGEHEFEVLAIEDGGNQTITSDSFVLGA